MRSRYSAYALGRVEYLVRSWHPSTRPAALSLDPDLEWQRLDVVEAERGGPGDRTGAVTFRAHFRRDDQPGVLAERSRFTRHDGCWVYLDGTVPGDRTPDA